MKPKIFISSTIYDFKDLRSSLKYYLEGLGYQVLLSEYNDFTKNINLNTYKACLNTINESDYFILLIGSRVGGFFNKEKNISITQKEYQVAYNKVIKSQLKIIIFIRSEIWTIKEDRKALIKYLENDFIAQKELSKDEIGDISNHRSKFVNNANFIFNFIDEVCKKDEMIIASQGKGEFPKNNWVHSFNNFSDIIEVLNLELNIKTPLEIISLQFNLRNELNDILSNLLTKQNSGKLIKDNEWSSFARRDISDNINEKSKMPFKYFKWLTIFALIGTTRSSNIKTFFIERAVTSGTFLEFDNNKNVIKDSKLSYYLNVLLDKVSILKVRDKYASEAYHKIII